MVQLFPRALHTPSMSLRDGNWFEPRIRTIRLDSSIQLVRTRHVAGRLCCCYPTRYRFPWLARLSVFLQARDFFMLWHGRSFSYRPFVVPGIYFLGRNASSRSRSTRRKREQSNALCLGEVRMETISPLMENISDIHVGPGVQTGSARILILRQLSLANRTLVLDKVGRLTWGSARLNLPRFIFPEIFRPRRRSSNYSYSALPHPSHISA